MSQDQTLLETMLQAAHEAGQLVLEVYKGDFAVNYKGPNDPVTRADREANELICTRLSRAYPDIAIVAEESDTAGFQGYQASERIFFVDPLDGTREFVARNDEFVVMIGLVVKQQATIGVVLSPCTNTVWAGIVGVGAWKIQDGKQSPISVSTVSSMQGAHVVLSRSRPPERLSAAIQEYGVRTTRVGSAGLKAAFVAEGIADVYCAPGYAGCHWDVCAGDALVVAAGGSYTDAAGKLYNYRTDELRNTTGIAACNPALHPQLVELLQRRKSGERQ